MRIFDIVSPKNMVKVNQLSLKIKWGHKYDPLSPKKEANMKSNRFYTFILILTAMVFLLGTGMV
ncbi:MAG: hypothetical protein WBM78_13850, partial [Desulfobacterales bacterium]